LRREREEADKAAEKEEGNTPYNVQQRKGRTPAFIPTQISRPRGADTTNEVPDFEREETQPVVKPPNAKPKNPFQTRPTFTSPPKGSTVSETDGERGISEYSSTSWQNQGVETPFVTDGGSSSSSHQNTSREQDNSPQNGSNYQMQSPPSSVNESLNGSVSSESEETSIGNFGNLPAFVDSIPHSTSDPNSSVEEPESDIASNYDASYFMNVPNNSEEEPQSFDYIQNWSSSNQGFSEQTNPALDDPSLGNNADNGSAWYEGNGAQGNANASPANPFSTRASMMNKGASYLENLSKSEASGSSGSITGGGSYSGTPPRENLQQQENAAQPDTTYPERIKAAYRDWCQYYGKEYNETRLGTFSSNFLAVERYHRETGVSLILNELADMTSEEFQQNKN